MLALRQQMEGKVSETTNEVQLCLSLTLIASFMAEHAPLHSSAVLLHVHVHTAHSLQTPWQKSKDHYQHNGTMYTSLYLYVPFKAIHKTPK